MSALVTKVVEVARRFVGQKEVGNNAGFADPAFQKEMQKSGFARGNSWCALLAETVFRVALTEENRAALWVNLEPLFSAGAVDTLHRFQKKGYTLRQIPQVGDLAVWQHGAGPAGHMGVVVAADLVSKSFLSVEGNTNGIGAAGTIVSNGDQVMLKKRRYGLALASFKLLGFVAPIS